MAGNGHDFEFRATEFGQACSRCLAKAMNRTVFEPSFFDPFVEPVSETVRGKRLAKARNKKCQVAGRGCVKDVLERWNNRKLHMNRLPLSIFLLREDKPPISNMLSAESDQVSTSLPCVKSKRERKPRCRADRVPFLESLDFSERPAMKTFGTAG